jgi:coproporphyrinogen III oxidase-like Fe-S oxidoreductase
MLSLYLHIPFCRQKCNYCSFFVMPQDQITGGVEEMKERYTDMLIQEIRWHHANTLGQQLKTVYIGWGTPLELGAERLKAVIACILQLWGSETLEELTIELNPNPMDEVLDFITQIHTTYPHVYRIRWSIGIQTLDDKLLAAMKREYTGWEAISFLRELPSLKQHNTVYAIDMIAMGVLDTKHQAPRTPGLRQVRVRLVESGAFDGFSVYGLELFPWSEWYYLQEHLHNSPSWNSWPHADAHPAKLRWSPDQVRDEFHWIKQTLLEAWYTRYELSNFARAGKRSIHNMVYRTHGSYIGCGIHSSSWVFTPQIQTDFPHIYQLMQNTKTYLAHPPSQSIDWVRWKNTHHRKQYRWPKSIDPDSRQLITERDSALETLMLQWRTDRGIPNFSTYAPYLVNNRHDLIDQRTRQWLVQYENDHLIVLDAWRDVYNTLMTDLITSFA